MYFGLNTFIIFRNTFSDITAAIYEIEEILNPPGLCIFVRGTQWWYLFCSIFENEDARADQGPHSLKEKFPEMLKFREFSRKFLEKS